MKIDMHIHTTYSDGFLTPDKAISISKQLGMDGICITDHNCFTQDPEIEKTALETELAVFIGMEYTSVEGDILVYGIRDDAILKKPRMHAQDIINFVNSIGGIAIPAHPYNLFGIGNKIDLKQLTGLYTIETKNGQMRFDENERAENTKTAFRLKGIGGSDAHLPSDLGKAYTLFEKEIRTIDELVHELKYGTYYAVRAETGDIWENYIKSILG